MGGAPSSRMDSRSTTSAASATQSRSPRGGGSIEESDLLEDYVAALRAQVSVAKSVRILHDPIHGVSSGLPSRILGRDVATIRGEINPSFGGVNPEPIAENLGASMAVMRGSGEWGVGSGKLQAVGFSASSPTPHTPPPTPYDLAICNDGDADRLGILDEKGSF